jgi:hypothetical protein
MDYLDKAEILWEFIQDERDNEEFERFFDWADLGLPIAVAVANNLCEINENGEAILDETWKVFCQIFENDENGIYEDLEDFYLQAE